MDSRQFDSYLKNNFTSFLSEARLKKKGNSFISVEQEEILKGFAFSRVDERLYVHWFILPFIPVTEDLSLDVGERLVGKHETRDLFLLKDEKLEKTTSMLKELIKEKIDTLKSINSIKNFYIHFYEQNNWDRLNNLWLKSELRNLERIIFAKAYLSIPFDEELKAFREKWESDDRNHVSWMQDMNHRMDT